MKKELFVVENKTMCLFPWTHMYVHTTGDVYPCCIAHPGTKELSLGNVKTSSIEDIWNGNAYKNLRKNMVEGIRVNNCSECYKRETTEGRNYRHTSFHMFDNNLNGFFENTNEDFSVKNVDIKYFDIRFSNLCSFKCRYCLEELSTTWAAENRKRGKNGHLPAYIHVSDNNPDFMNHLKKHMGGVEHMYFAGGEPLMTDEHYEVLQTLIDNNKTDVQLRYSSNCSIVKFKNYDVTEMWNKFHRVDFRASLDSFGKRAEYMRKGTDWNEILSNVLYIKKHAPIVEISINCVVSAYNIMTLTDFLEHLFHHDIISWESTQVVLYPVSHDQVSMDPNILPVELKKTAKDKLQKLINKVPRNTKLLPELYRIKNYLTEIDPNPNDWKSFKAFNEDLDVFRGERFAEVFPELADWYNAI